MEKIKLIPLLSLLAIFSATEFCWSQDLTKTKSEVITCNEQPLNNLLLEFTKTHSGVDYSSSDPTTQCSGIFQRVLNSIKKECPDLTKRLPPENIISSRNQAKWYFNQNALTCITDPIEQSNLIEIGMVMFYGRKSQTYYNDNPIEEFWSSNNGIKHVGIVVALETDPETGELQSYSLFHGRRPGIKSGISNADNYMHRRMATNKSPSFGNGPDPWIGIAPIVIPFEHE